jgi:hypothetical protein
VPMRAAPMPHRPHRAPQPLLGRPPLDHTTWRVIAYEGGQGG